MKIKNIFGAIALLYSTLIFSQTDVFKTKDTLVDILDTKFRRIKIDVPKSKLSDVLNEIKKDTVYIEQYTKGGKIKRCKAVRVNNSPALKYIDFI